MRSASSIGAPSRFAVTRPVPIPSVIDEPPSVFRTPSLMKWYSALPGGIDENDSYRSGLRLQIVGGARQRAAGARGCAEGVDLAVGVAPDFRPRRLEMSIAICGVVELIGPDRVGQLLRQAARHLLILVGVAVGNRGHFAQFRPQCLDDLVLLGRLIVGHHDHAFIAPCIAHVREPDPGVAGGALDHRTAALQQPALLGIQNDPLCGAVLHGAAGIHEFRLSQDLAAGFFAQSAQANQRGVADRVRKSITHVHQ